MVRPRSPFRRALRRASFEAADFDDIVRVRFGLSTMVFKQAARDPRTVTMGPEGILSRAVCQIHRIHGETLRRALRRFILECLTRANPFPSGQMPAM